MNHDLVEQDRDEQIRYIHERLQSRAHLPAEGLRPSAVLVPLGWVGKHPHVILTKRSMSVEYHKGEISFPGGGVEDHDTDRIATALREASEEIGLAPSDVEVLGRLDDYRTLIGFHITPVVGAVPYPYPFRINSESESLILLDLEHAMRDDVWMTERYDMQGRQGTLFYLEHAEGVIWGATGRMLKQFVDLIAGRPIPCGALSEKARAWVRGVMETQAIYRRR